MANKQQFIRKTQAVIAKMAQLQEEISGLAGVYTARGYQAGGSDAIVEADLVDAGVMVPLASFNEGVGALGDYLAFCGNTAVATQDRKLILNRVREDI